MSRFTEVFRRLTAEGRSALMPYVTAGDPSLDVTERLVDTLIAGGADMVELGGALLGSPCGRPDGPGGRPARTR